ncbi:MAG: protein kinase [Candidatus Acidiferrales bacterium]
MTNSAYSLETVARAICTAKSYVFGGGIGQGSFKETFLVTSPGGEKLALKVLRIGCSTVRSDREVDAMKRCKHPNIAALLELAEFEHQGEKYCYLIESYMGGGTLEARLKKPLAIREELLALGDQLIRAVAHIADLELVHRDFKPANIMYPSDSAEAVVGDFGIVRDLRKESLTQSHLAVGPGTPFFAAPEQLNNEKALIDWRTDQFAIGVTLTLAHFGFHPYQEPGDDAGAAVGRAAARRGPSESFRQAATTAKLPVLPRMVAAWPVERYRTPGLLLEEWRKQ